MLTKDSGGSDEKLYLLVEAIEISGLVPQNEIRHALRRDNAVAGKSLCGTAASTARVDSFT